MSEEREEVLGLRWGTPKFRGRRGKLELPKECEKALLVKQENQECVIPQKPSKESISRREK